MLRTVTRLGALRGSIVSVKTSAGDLVSGEVVEVEGTGAVALLHIRTAEERDNYFILPVGAAAYIRLLEPAHSPPGG